MTNSIQALAITQQLAILNEALEDQKISPNLEMDLKCAVEMKKLLTIIEEVEKHTGVLEDIGLDKVYTVLENNKESYSLGLERLSCESFASHFFYFDSKAPWEVGEAACSQLLMKNEILVKLNKWVMEAEPGEARLEAKARILTCLKEKSSSLDLARLSLNALPDIFDNLTLLTELDVRHNYTLTALPESIGKLTRLTTLNVSVNKLTALPESIGNLKLLTRLEVSINELATLPKSIGNLTALTRLDVSRNKLTALPENIGNLKRLTSLHVDSNQLTVLPESIGNLRALKMLKLENNKLTALPESIGNLITLQNLLLLFNSTLTGISNGVLHLPPTCNVDLTGCGLSQTVITNLDAAVTAPGYHGPRIHHSVLEPAPQRPQRSLPELFQDLTAITGRTLALPNLQGPDLQMWLGRLCDLADYKSGEAKKEGLANNVQDYLLKANDDPAFREMFYPIIHGAAETCGDRVALSLVHLGIAHDLSKVDVKDMKTLANFLIRGVFVMGLLEDTARAKVASLRFVDEIEVYLGYPVMLKERLRLPINTDKMLYARCSNITEQDLSAATSFVNEQISNVDIICNFLVNQDKWKEALKENYPKEMESLEVQKDLSLEGASSSADYAAIESRFNTGLIEITKRVL